METKEENSPAREPKAEVRDSETPPSQVQVAPPSVIRRHQTAHVPVENNDDQPPEVSNEEIVNSVQDNQIEHNEVPKTTPYILQQEPQDNFEEKPITYTISIPENHYGTSGTFSDQVLVVESKKINLLMV